jgi:DNA-binding transcriptional LysR family regulator
MHHASAMGMMSAIRSGLGIAVLPCIIADTDPDLINASRQRKAMAGRCGWLPTSASHTPRVGQ